MNIKFSLLEKPYIGSGVVLGNCISKLKFWDEFSYFLRFEDRAYGASGATASALKSIKKETNNLTQTHTLINTQTHTHTYTVRELNPFL